MPQVKNFTTQTNSCIVLRLGWASRFASIFLVFVSGLGFPIRIILWAGPPDSHDSFRRKTSTILQPWRSCPNHLETLLEPLSKELLDLSKASSSSPLYSWGSRKISASFKCREFSPASTLLRLSSKTARHSFVSSLCLFLFFELLFVKLEFFSLQNVSIATTSLTRSRANTS